MKKLVSAAAIAFALSACQSATKPRSLSAADLAAPVRPGETRLSMRNIDREKWAAGRADTRSAARTVFACRPLACPSPSAVIYTRLGAPTRKPDRQAVLKLGETIRDKIANEGATIRSEPRTSMVKGYPAVSFSFSKDNRGKIEYTRWIAVFSGSLSFNLQSISADDAVAARNLDQFLAAVEILDGGSRQDAAR